MQSLLSNLWNLTRIQLQNNKSSAYFLLSHRLYCAPTTAATDIKPINEPSNAKEQKGNVQKNLNIAVIGMPNAGKSTFINNLINRRVCPTSCKVHTTRKANKAVHTTGHTQLVFYDTPGLVTQREIKKHHLEQSFKSQYRYAIQHADMIAVIHDVSNTWTRKQLHSTVVDSLKAYPQLPSILIMNKIDALKSKRITLELIRLLTNDTLSGVKKASRGKRKQLDELTETKEVAPSSEFSDLHKNENTWSNFSEVFLVSSVTGNGLHAVHDYLLSNAKGRSWQHPGDAFTDESPEDLIVESVRARLLDFLPQEIPYNLQTNMEFYSIENNTIYASVEVVCPTKRIERLICGESNGRLRQITERVTSDLVETFGKPISFTIATSSKEKSKENAKQ